MLCSTFLINGLKKSIQESLQIFSVSHQKVFIAHQVSKSLVYKTFLDDKWKYSFRILNKLFVFYRMAIGQGILVSRTGNLFQKYHRKKKKKTSKHIIFYPVRTIKTQNAIPFPNINLHREKHTLTEFASDVNDAKSKGIARFTPFLLQQLQLGDSDFPWKLAYLISRPTIQIL